MKRLIVLVVALPIAAWMMLWIFAAAMERSIAARPWPYGLQGLDSVPPRYPERLVETPAATALRQLAAPLGVDVRPRDERPRPALPARKSYEAIKQPLQDYINAQLARPSAAIDPPPPILAAYFAEHRAQLDAVRAHLLSGAPIAWKVQLSRRFDAPIPNLLGHMELARLFLADALLEARSGDAAAWDDLRALRLLDANLYSRPDIISQLIALACTRMVNAAAAKLPLPEPPWFAEVRAFDYRRALASSVQTEAWLWTQARPADIAEEPGLLRVFVVLTWPYARLSIANTAEHMRVAMTDAAKSSACDVSGESLGVSLRNTLPRWNIFGRVTMPDLSSAWHRLARVTAELETSEKALQLRRGALPGAASHCSDGT